MLQFVITFQSLNVFAVVVVPLHKIAFNGLPEASLQSLISQKLIVLLSFPLAPVVVLKTIVALVPRAEALLLSKMQYVNVFLLDSFCKFKTELVPLKFLNNKYLPEPPTLP